MNFSKAASNALLAKCRAMFGKRLTPQNFADLMSCRSVGEVAAYLKSNTDYADALSSVNETEVHRGQLENALDKQLFKKYESLCRYELSVGENTADYILLKTELRQLLKFLRLLSAGKPQDYIFSLPSFFAKHTKVDIMRLSQVTTYGEFLSAIELSPFYPLFKQKAPAEGEDFVYSVIDTAAHNYFYENAIKNAEKNYTGSAKKEMLDLLGTRIELNNVLTAYRLKKYFRADTATISAMIYPYHRKIKAAELREMMLAENSREILKKFYNETYYGRNIHQEDLENVYFDNVVRMLVYRCARHYIRSSVNPSTVIMAYLMLSETEISDIVTIIESVRYLLPPSKINELIATNDA
ncbi:MAG: V-type ATPase subunit [Oscillospiraceae bacterium]|jgi:V/A-type H+-transporting ATPase subunit C|nr:V-type ATPase subunit [Oscillospiraceae bacterium]